MAKPASCQRLPAKAGAARAEDNDIGRPVRKLTRRIPDCFQIAVSVWQAQQRQTAVCVAGTEPIEGIFGPLQSGFQRTRTDAVRPDVFFARVVDRLDNAHAGICLESRARRNGRNKAAILWFRST
jgi:hypothetical protein